jgi:hypothetical protein
MQTVENKSSGVHFLRLNPLDCRFFQPTATLVAVLTSADQCDRSAEVNWKEAHAWPTATKAYNHSITRKQENVILLKHLISIASNFNEIASFQTWMLANLGKSLFLRASGLLAIKLAAAFKDAVMQTLKNQMQFFINGYKSRH